MARVGGVLAVPGDKSISHRAIMLGALAEGETRVRGFLRGEDCLATLAAFRAMGVPIRDEGGEVTIEGVGLHGLQPPQGVLDLGNSGTAIRLMTGLLAGQRFDSELTGDESLRRRPMERVAAPLRLMGAAIETRDGKPPIRIRGGRRLRGIDYTLPVASAQVKSALLLAGLYAQGPTTVHSPGVTRDHTEVLLAAMDADVRVGPDRVVRLRPGRLLHALDLEVPGDFSSAAFFLVAGCLGADDGLVLRNVGINPTRTGLLEILRAMGADIELRDRRAAGGEPVADLLVCKRPLRGVDVPPELVPLAIDEFPALFVAAAGAAGRTTVRGAEELRAKESDRIAVMAEGLRTLGAAVEELPDGLVIEGGRLGGGTIDSRGDHRVAMSFAVASLIAEAPIEILHTAEVATSFPGFVETAAMAGLRVTGSGGRE